MRKVDSPSDSLYGRAYHVIGSHYYSTRSYDSAIVFFNNSIAFYENRAANNTQGLNYLNVGSALFFRSELDLALESFDKSIEIFTALQDTANATKATINKSVVLGKLERPIEQISLLKASRNRLAKDDWKSRLILNANLGECFSKLSLNDSSLVYFLKAVKLAEEHQDSISLSFQLGNLAQAFSNLKINEKATQYARKALLVNRKIQRKTGIAYSLFALGRIKDDLNQSDSSLWYYRRAYDNTKDQPSPLLSSIYHNVGLVFLGQNNIDSAHHYLNLAEQEKRKNDRVHLGSVFSHLAEVELLKNHLQRSKNYLDSAKYYAFNLGSFKQVVEYFRVSALYNAQAGNLAESKSDFSNFAAYSDSMINESNTRYALYMSQLYEAEAKEAAIKDLLQEQTITHLELSQTKLQRKSLLISLILSVLIVAAVVWAFVSNRRNYKKLQTANKQVEKQNLQLETLNKEIFHRAKNNLHTISSLLGLQQYELQDQAAKELMASNQSRINTMAMINKRLFDKNEIKQADFVAFTEELIEELNYVYDLKQGILQLSANTPHLFCSDKVAVPLGLIANELISNAIKYGLTNTEPIIQVMIRKTDEKVQFEVKDNGSGFDNSKPKPDSFGEEMIHMMAEQLDAHIERSNEEGARIVITFKPEANNGQA